MDIEQMRIRLGEMAAEIERLHTEGDLLKQRRESPRITEQDAREVAGSVIRYCNTRKNVAWDTDSYMRETGRDLLTKLNKPTQG